MIFEIVCLGIHNKKGDMSGLFAGGTLSEQDKDAVMKALQDIYWESKARNVEKYTPKKYKKTGTDAEE